MLPWLVAVVCVLLAVVSVLKARSSTRQAGEVANFVIGLMFDEDLREASAEALVKFAREETHPTPELLAHTLRRGIIHNASRVWAETNARNCLLLWGMNQTARLRPGALVS